MENLPIRYLQFIDSRRIRTLPIKSSVERHHILPRSMGGLDSPENIIILSFREHWIAHYILWKELKTLGALSAIVRMGRFHPTIYSSRKYETLKKQFYKEMGDLAKSSFWITNGSEDRRCPSNQFSEFQQNGWRRGRSSGMKEAHEKNKTRIRTTEEKAEISERVRNSVWVTNGISQHFVRKEDLGDFLLNHSDWKLGVSETMKLHIGNASKGRSITEDHKQKLRIAFTGKKRSLEISKKISESRKRRKSCWVSRGEEMRMIFLDQLDQAIIEGWVRGCKTSKAIERLSKASKQRKLFLIQKTDSDNLSIGGQICSSKQ